MFAIFNPVDRKMATVVRNRAKKAPGKDTDKRVHSLSIQTINFLYGEIKRVFLGFLETIVGLLCEWCGIVQCLFNLLSSS